MKLFYAAAFLATTLSLPAFADETIYKLDGKDVKTSDLSPAAQQQVFEAQIEAYEKTRQIVENNLLDSHLDAESKKSGKPKDEIFKNLTKVAEVKEKDAKEWYEKNKARIPYPFEQIKGEVVKLLENEKREEKKQELVKKLKSDKKFSFELKRPEAPVIQVNVAGFPTKGGKDAKVTIVEFADYQCPHCKEAAPVMKQLADKYKDKIKLVYVDYPINPSGISKIIAQGAFCAMQQNKFWEYNQLAFSKQPNVDRETPNKLAKELGLNEGDFKKCAESTAALDHVNKGKAEGERVGVSGTPFILINGKRHLAGHTFEDFKKTIDQLL